VWDADTHESHFVISPAQISLQKTVVLEPGASNMFDDPDKSSLESNFAGWRFPLCAWTTCEVTVDEKKHGNSCLHLLGSVSVDCPGGITSPGVTVETGKTYQGRFWIKSRGGSNCTLKTRYAAPAAAGEAVHVHLEDAWQQVILEPYTIKPSDGNSLRLFTYLGDYDQEQGSEQIDVYIDCLQIEQIPGTSWQLGGIHRADTGLRSVKSLPCQWTNVFTLYPSGRKDHFNRLGEGTELHIKSWLAGDTCAELYFDPNAPDPNKDDEFVLFVTDGTNSVSGRTNAQHFQRHAQIKFAIVCYQDDSDGNKTKLKMHVANGQPVETVSISTSEDFRAFALGTIITCAGYKDEFDVFPGLLSHDDFVARAIDDEDIRRLLDIAGTGILAADLNGDLCVNFEDLSIFAWHWLDKGCMHPERCGGTDLDWSGEVDYADMAAFAENWLAILDVQL
jgi:hypothetical protein